MSAPDLIANEYIHTAAEPALRAQWPQRIVELTDVVQAAFVREHLPADQADKLAALAVLSIAFYIGGRPVYLPVGSRVRDAVRRRLIFRAWQTGESVQALQARFGVSHETVYAAIREGRASAGAGT